MITVRPRGYCCASTAICIILEASRALFIYSPQYGKPSQKEKLQILGWSHIPDSSSLHRMPSESVLLFFSVLDLNSFSLRPSLSPLLLINADSSQPILNCYKCFVVRFPDQLIFKSGDPWWPRMTANDQRSPQNNLTIYVSKGRVPGKTTVFL